MLLFYTVIFSILTHSQSKLGQTLLMDPVAGNSNISALRWRDVRVELMTSLKQLCLNPLSCSSPGDTVCTPCDFCYCDDLCFPRGDCCLDKMLDAIGDSLVRETVKEHQATAYFDCVDVRFKDFRFIHDDPEHAQKLITSCPSNFNNTTDVKSMCEDSGSLADNVTSPEKNTRDLTKNWPVASTSSKFSYKNHACAKCHGESADGSNLIPWNLQISCRGINLAANSKKPKEIFDFAMESRECLIALVVPVGFQSRSCKIPVLGSEITTTCNSTGRRTKFDSLLWRACESPFPNYVTRGASASYHSVFCAACQEDRSIYLQNSCGYGGGTPLFVLFSPDALEEVKDSQGQGHCGCEDGYLLDSYSNQCLELHCERGKTLLQGRCVSQAVVAQGLAYVVSLKLTGLVSPEQRDSMTETTFPGEMERDEQISEMTEQIQEKFFSKLFNSPSPDVTCQYFVVHGLSVNFSQSDFFSLSIFVTLQVDHPIVADDFEFKLLELGNNHTWFVDVNGVELMLKSTFTPFINSKVLKRLAPNWVDYESLQTDQSSYVEYYYYFNKEVRDPFVVFFGLFSGMFLEVKNTLLCPFLAFNLTESYEEFELVVVDADSRTAQTYELRHNRSGQIFSPLDFRVNEEENVIYLCADAFVAAMPSAKKHDVTTIDTFGLGLVVTSYVCLGLSILTLSLTLFTYCLFPVLRTQPGKANMSFCVTLMSAITLFLIGGFVVDVTIVCHIVGVATHFFLLSSFTWMVICTAHAYYVFSNLLEPSLGQRFSYKRFISYTFISLLVPALIVSTTITANYVIAHATANETNRYTNENNNRKLFVKCQAPTDWIGYGVGVCYLSNKLSLILAGIGPILLACVINLCAFLRAIFSLRSMTSQQKLVRKDTKSKLFVYLKLSSLTGLNWLPCMIATFVSNVVLWYIFLILCGLQGVYVFAAFCLNKRVLGLYRKRFIESRGERRKKYDNSQEADGSKGKRKCESEVLKHGSGQNAIIATVATTTTSFSDARDGQGERANSG